MSYTIIVSIDRVSLRCYNIKNFLILLPYIYKNSNLSTYVVYLIRFLLLHLSSNYAAEMKFDLTISGYFAFLSNSSVFINN